MPRTPLISVIMSVHNHEAYVRPAVESVLAQTFAAWELILINNGSTDGSARLIDDLAGRDARIVPIHQPNHGLPAARNRGISLACAPWIAYLDSDDLWYPGRAEAYARHVRRRPEAQCFYGTVHRLRGSRVSLRNRGRQDRPIGTPELFEHMILTPQAVCHRRELWDRAGRFDPCSRWCDDYDLFLRMSLHGPFEPIDQALGLRRRHGSNLSTPSGASQQAEAEMLYRFAQQHGRDQLDNRLIARRLGQVYARAARSYYRERRYPQALALAQHAHAWAPSWRNGLIGWLSRWLLARTAADAVPPVPLASCQWLRVALNAYRAPVSRVAPIADDVAAESPGESDACFRRPVTPARAD